MAGTLGWRRSLLFASGDFACNLYWQSMTFYLLFFYTDVLGLSATVAGLITLVASIWDGVAGIGVGILASRRDKHVMVSRYTLPLACSFLLIYLPLPISGTTLAGVALLAHILFRTCYVAVNVPYAAMTLDVAPDSAARSRIGGLRMIFGGAAAVLVGLTTQGSTLLATTMAQPRLAFFVAALSLALIGTLVLFRVAALSSSSRNGDLRTERLTVRDVFATIAGNRSYIQINLGICGGVVAMAVLTRALPYYFKYRVGSEAAGSGALAAMGIAGVLAIPVWMRCARRFGSAAQWQISTGTAGLAMTLLVLGQPSSPLAAQMLFVLFQVGGQGLFFSFWAQIPDAIEYGGCRRKGADTLMFAIAALAQKVTLGAAVSIFGLLLSGSGYLPNRSQPDRVIHELTLLTGGLPLIGLAAASLAMLQFKLRSTPLALVDETGYVHGELSSRAE